VYDVKYNADESIAIVSPHAASAAAAVNDDRAVYVAGGSLRAFS